MWFSYLQEMKKTLCQTVAHYVKIQSFVKKVDFNETIFETSTHPNL